MSFGAPNRSDRRDTFTELFGEPEPVEAEFEPADDAPFYARENRKTRAPPRQRSRYVGYRDLLFASLLSGSIGVAGGAAVAVAVTGGDSGASTGTLAQQIATLSRSHDALAARAAQSAQDVAALRAQVAGQAETLRAQQQTDAALRIEITAVTGQVSALAGLGDGAPVAGARASDSPLGVLLARLNRMETILAADASAPATTRQTQRAMTDLAARVTTLAAEQARFAVALNRRHVALDTLETGLEAAQLQLAGISARVDNLSPRPATPATFIVPEGSRVIRALATLETAAASGRPFLSQQKTLAALLPSDPDVVALENTARNGAPSLENLRRDFNDAAHVAERLAASPRWAWLGRALPGPAGDPAAAPPAPHLIAARMALETGDVAAALEAVERLEGPSAAVFAPWRARAAVRAGLDQSLQALTLRLTGPAAQASEG